MEISSSIYQVFYQQLLNAVVEKLYDGKEPTMKRTSPTIWEDEKHIKHFYEHLLKGSGLGSVNYFYRLHDKMNTQKVFKAKINDIAFYNALQYIGYKDSSSRTEMVKLKYMYEQFIDENAEIIQTELEKQLEYFINYLDDFRINDKSKELISTNIKLKKSEEASDHPDANNSTFIKSYYMRLANTHWWLYFHDDDSFRVFSKKNGTWTLVRLPVSFLETQNDSLSVIISNTGTYSHSEYVGSIDYTHSQEGMLIINCQTSLPKKRNIQIRFNVGTDLKKLNDTILVGQYLNDEIDGHVISGSIILQHIGDVAALDFSPQVFSIQNPPDESGYNVDIHGIDFSILQFLWEKEKNFRRTPLRSGNNLSSLKQWLQAKRAEKS